MGFKITPFEATIYELGPAVAPTLTSQLDESFRFKFFPLKQVFSTKFKGVSCNIVLFITDTKNPEHYISIAIPADTAFLPIGTPAHAIINFIPRDACLMEPMSFDTDDTHIYLHTSREQMVLFYHPFGAHAQAPTSWKYPEITFDLAEEEKIKYAQTAGRLISTSAVGHDTVNTFEITKKDKRVRFWKVDKFFNVFVTSPKRPAVQKLLPNDVVVMPVTVISGDRKMLYVFYGSCFRAFLVFNDKLWVSTGELNLPIEVAELIEKTQKNFIANHLGTSFAIIIPNKIFIIDAMGRIIDQINLGESAFTPPQCVFLHFDSYDFLAIKHPDRISVYLLGREKRKFDISIHDIISVKNRVIINVSFLAENQIAFTVVDNYCQLKVIIFTLPLGEILKKARIMLPAVYAPDLSTLNLGARPAAGAAAGGGAAAASPPRTPSPRGGEEYFATVDSPVRPGGMRGTSSSEYLTTEDLSNPASPERRERRAAAPEPIPAYAADGVTLIGYQLHPGGRILPLPPKP